MIIFFKEIIFKGIVLSSLKTVLNRMNYTTRDLFHVGRQVKRDGMNFRRSTPASLRKRNLNLCLVKNLPNCSAILLNSIFTIISFRN